MDLPNYNNFSAQDFQFSPKTIPFDHMSETINNNFEKFKGPAYSQIREMSTAITDNMQEEKNEEMIEEESSSSVHCSSEHKNNKKPTWKIDTID